MDWATIIVGGLAFIGTLVGAYLSNNKTVALVTYRLQELEKKVQKHNNVVERMAVVEKNVETAFREINEVKDYVHEIKNK